MTSSESSNYFYNNRHKKEKEKFIDWCDICKKETEQLLVVGHTGFLLCLFRMWK